MKNKLNYKIWIDKNLIESNVKQQIDNLCSLPFAFHHIAVMPDCHTGYGMPIGGVLAAKNAIIPNAVGVDIGCGMHAVQTSLQKSDTELLKKIINGIKYRVPVGFEHNKCKNKNVMPKGFKIYELPIVEREYESALYQVGTLGGGNHFIEIQKDEKDFIWFMIHSGSRNLGKQVADYYNRLAKKLNITYKDKIPESFDLAFLHWDSEEAQTYFKEMNYCMEFAKCNRQAVSNVIKEIFQEYTSCSFIDEYDIQHNYASQENHFGEDVIVHRKGATSARKDEIGIIPGSQGSESYVVKGLGNPDSFMSCSHGAGRKMSRTRAKKELDLAEERNKLEKKGILHALRSRKDLDEASGAYKDINEIIDLQKDLVEVVTKLSPLAVIKG